MYVECPKKPKMSFRTSRILSRARARRRFLAFGSVTMIDPLDDFDQDNAVAFDIYKIDGVKTGYRVYGGDHWGEARRAENVYDGAYVGYGQRIEFWLRSIHHQDLDAFGVGVVIILD